MFMVEFEDGVIWAHPSSSYGAAVNAAIEEVLGDNAPAKVTLTVTACGEGAVIVPGPEKAGEDGSALPLERGE